MQHNPAVLFCHMNKPGYGCSGYSGVDWDPKAPIGKIDLLEMCAFGQARSLARGCSTLGFSGLLPGMQLAIDPAVIPKYHLKPYAFDPEIWKTWSDGKKRLRVDRGTNSIPGRKVRTTDPKYTAHLEDLSRVNYEARCKDHLRQALPNETLSKCNGCRLQQLRHQLITPCTVEELKFISRYFAVPKDESVWRAIFNGKELSKYWCVPPPVNIPDTASLIQKLRSTTHEHKNKKLFYVVSDWRNFFYAWGVNPVLQRHFGIALDCKRCFRFRCLPMGWSMSPWIAQSFAWGLLGYRNPNQKAMLNEIFFKGDQLPTFVPTLKGGFVTVYYDNFLMVTPDEEEAREFRKRLENNCENLFNVQFKSGTLQSGSLQEGLSYLGIFFKILNDGRLSWYAIKTKKWEEKMGKRPTVKTARVAAQWCGKMNFVLQTSLKKLCSHEDGRILLQAMSAVGQIASKSGWDAAFIFPQPLLNNLYQVWERVLRTSEHPYVDDEEKPATPQETKFVLLSDACDIGYGYQSYRWENGILMDDKMGDGSFSVRRVMSFRGESLKMHIYMKEMKAVVEGIQDFFKVHPDVTNLVVVVDNSAVAWGLRYGFTNHLQGMKEIQKIAEVINRINVVQVQSNDNAADCHSRDDFSEYEVRLAKCGAAIQSDMSGLRTGTFRGADARTLESMRSVPPAEQPIIPEDFQEIFEEVLLEEEVEA